MEIITIEGIHIHTLYFIASPYRVHKIKENGRD